MSDFTEKVRAMLDAATPGPWSAFSDDDHTNIVAVVPYTACVFSLPGRDKREPDVELVSSAPTLLREACERIEKLEKVKEECSFALDIADAEIVTSTPEAWEDVSNVGGRQYEKLREMISALEAADAEEK